MNLTQTRRFETGCRRGKWRFCFDPSAPILAYPDEYKVETSHFVNQHLAPFWVENGNGARVSRTPVGPWGNITFCYFTEDFCIGINPSITTTDSYEDVRLIERGKAAMPDCVTILHSSRDTWVNTMTEDQYESFLDDVSDLDLYFSLFDCTPNEWLESSSAYRTWGAKLYQPIELLEFWVSGSPGYEQNGRLGAQGCFRFLATMIKFKAWWPKDSYAQRTYESYQSLLDGRDPANP